ncbi:MAG: MFS transporter [Actinobacteria bacterium]|nr:MFS transporter [Actinomycetota bacterium]
MAQIRNLSAVGLTALIGGQLISQLDFAAVNVALHSIGQRLGASGAQLELVVAVYGVAFAVTLVLGGQLGDAVGRRTVFVAGVAGFLAASLWCGLAPTAGALLLARAAQGVTAALIVPQVLATIHVTTSGPHAVRALGLYGSIGGLSFVVGQVLGGVLVGADVLGLGWRAVFLINVPVALAVLALARFVPQTRAQRRPRVDVVGTVLLGGALVALMLPAALGPTLGWPWWTVALLCLAPVGLAGLARVERRRELRGLDALVPPSVLRIPSMRTGLLVGALFFGSWSGLLFALTLTVQAGGGRTATATGVMFVPLGVVFFVTASRSARLSARLGPARTVLVGAVVQVVGVATTTLVVLGGHAGGAWIQAGLVLVGAGNGVIVASVFRLCLADVPAALAGSASAVVSTVQQASLGLGAPVLGSVYLVARQHTGSPARGFAAAMVVEVAMVVGVGLVAAVAARAGRRPGGPAREASGRAAVPADLVRQST